MKTINLIVLVFVALFWVPLLPFYFIQGLRGTFEDWEHLKNWQQTVGWAGILALQLGLAAGLGFLLYGLAQVALESGGL